MNARYVAKRRSQDGSRPWGVFDTQKDVWIELRRVTPAGAFAGYIAFFKLKRDAQAAIDAIIPEEGK